MYEIIFYHDKGGRSEVVELLDDLGKKAQTNKNARVNRVKILAYLNILSQQGTTIGAPIVKHVEGCLWELRPMKNRIFFFYWKDSNFVVLHHFIKKTQKTPKKEIAQARLKLRDFLERNADQ